MKSTCTLNGESCVIEGSDQAVQQYLSDLESSGGIVRRHRDKSDGQSGIRVNGEEHVRVTRFVVNDDADDDFGLSLPSTAPAPESGLNVSGPVGWRPPAQPYWDENPQSYVGQGFPSFDDEHSLVDNVHGPDEGLSLPSTFVPLADERRQATANAAAKFDDGPGVDDGLDLPSTRPALR